MAHRALSGPGPFNEDEIFTLFARWKERLGLGEWKIDVRFERIKPKTTTMRVYKSVNYQRATIKVQPWILTGKPPASWQRGRGVITAEDIEEAIVHELLHICLGSLWCWAHLLDNRFGDDMQRTISTVGKVFDGVEEGIVDRLAVALVRAWPHTEDESLLRSPV